MARAHFLGIDLGTTNSTACLFDGDQVSPVRSSTGEVLTPSMVRIDRKGAISVGSRARKFLQRDSENTRGEFKRLMGTDHSVHFPASGINKRPEELAAEVLASLRKDAEAQLGATPDQAVIAVPALFELPQIRATSEAARLAGFSRVETIQEPVASALASGWSADEAAGSWLVYDLGGGTFDVSLLESQDGLLRVVGHDGDNFLGGRDFDLALAQVIAARIEREFGIKIDRSNPSHADAFSRLKIIAEEAKIELSRQETSVTVLVDGIEVDGNAIELFDCEVEVSEFERTARPLIERSIGVCERLLRGFGTQSLQRVVLVGGPTAMPSLRRRLEESLRAPFSAGLDPMTLVAQGAALFAATSGLQAFKKTRQVQSKGPKLWLQYPAMTPDMAPFVVGRCLDETPKVRAVRFAAQGGHEFDSGWITLETDGTFATMLSLKRRTTTDFGIEVQLDDGTTTEASPGEISVVHGVSVGDPPLARSIGVARADNSVAVYFERGTPLPCRKTFTHRSVERIHPGATDYALRVPIVQGDFPFAHLCRLVGVIEIPAASLKGPLPAGAVVELTLEVDRGGALTARASVPVQELLFEHVESLIAPGVSLDDMEKLIVEQTERGADARRKAFQNGDATTIRLLGDLDGLQADIRRDLEAARGGDRDAAEKARRGLIDADGLIGDVEARTAWPELTARAYERHIVASQWVEIYGTDAEKRSLGTCMQLVERALRAQNPKEVERQIRSLKALSNACYFRSPGAWTEQLDSLAGRVSEATDPKAAQRLVSRGMKAEASGDAKGVEKAVRQLWALFPSYREEQSLGFDSSVK